VKECVGERPLWSSHHLAVPTAIHTPTGVHGDYPGIAVFTGLQHGELLLEDILGKVDKVIEVATMPVTPTSTDLQALYAPLRTSFLDTYRAECNVLFKVRGLSAAAMRVWSDLMLSNCHSSCCPPSQVAEYYSYDYGSFTKRIMAKKFREAPDRKPVPLIYAANEFVIAVHVRTGDIDPTAESFFVNVLTQILPHLENVPYRIHVFAEDKGQSDYPGIASSVASRDQVVFHPAMPPFETFYHLTQSHVFVMAASGFSQFAALLATKPLVFSPPSRETFPLKFCPPYAVCCDKEGRFEMEGTLRLHRRKERWLASQLQRTMM